MIITCFFCADETETKTNPTQKKNIYQIHKTELGPYQNR